MATTNTTVKNPVQIMDWQTKLAQGNTNAQTRNVQANETVNKQLTDLTAGNSRYINTARQKAGEAASRQGMMTSSMAAGNAERAAIESALPIAQQDASTYAKTASENMAAVNADRLADQQMHGQLTGQEVGIRANLDEAERARAQQTAEREATQKFQTSEREGAQKFQTGERTAAEKFQTGERVGQNTWQGTQNTLQREHERNMTLTDQAFKSAQAALDRNFNGTQADKQYAAQRFEQFNQAMVTANNNLSNTLAAIYSNPNLKASEQKAAADNARAVHASLLNSYAATMSAGVPEIFWQPYQMGSGSAPTTTPRANTPPPSPAPPSPAPGSGGGGGAGGPYAGVSRIVSESARRMMQ